MSDDRLSDKGLTQLRLLCPKGADELLRLRTELAQAKERVRALYGWLVHCRAYELDGDEAEECDRLIAATKPALAASQPPPAKLVESAVVEADVHVRVVTGRSATGNVYGGYIGCTSNEQASRIARALGGE